MPTTIHVPPHRPANAAEQLGALAALSQSLAGARDIAGVLIAMVPFGVMLGALASQQGLAPGAMAAMSAAVFAGASQLVALELWADPVPVLALTIATAVANLRHLLLGAVIAPHFAGVKSVRVGAALFFLTDEVWALSLRRAQSTPLTLPYYLGLALPLYLGWIASTWIGAHAGATIGDPAQYGLDFAMTAMFLCILVSMVKAATPSSKGSRQRHHALWTATVTGGVVAAIAHGLLPGALYILLGALVGAAAGAYITVRTQRRGPPVERASCQNNRAERDFDA